MEKEIIRLLSEFVSFQTTADNQKCKAECLDWIAHSFLSEHLKDLKRGEHNGSPYLYLEQKNSELLWFAHIDVVPADQSQFTLAVKGDKAYGRGAKDMKGGALPFLMAYRDIVASGKNPRVSILLTSDEEVAGSTIPHLLDERIVTAPVAFTPDTGSAPWIVIGHKGVIWADLIVEGKSGHAAMPWESTNPVPLLSEAIMKITETFPTGSKDDWQLTVTPVKLSGGDARNQVASEARCSLDIRFPPEDFSSPDDVLEQVRKVLPAQCRLEPVTITSGLRTDPKHPMIQILQKIAGDVVEEEIPTGVEHGATDARYFGERGIPAFLYGPYGEGLHGPDEWVSVQSLVDHYAINSQWLLELL